MAQRTGPEAIVDGYVIAAGSSARSPAQIRRDGATLVLVSGGEEALLEVTQLDVSDPIPGVPRRVGLADGRLFETADSEGVDAVLAGLRRLPFRRLARLERFGPHLLVVALLTVAALLWLIRYGLPGAADTTAVLVPHHVEDQIGAATLDAFDRGLLAPSKLSDARKAELEMLFDRVADRSSYQRQNLRLVFRSSPVVGPNAFAMPGGQVVITDELVAIASSDVAIAGVLAHEIGHIEARHGLKRVLRSAGLGVIALTVGGDASGLVAEASGFGALIADRAYSRAFEREADARAIAIMQGAGEPLTPMADLFDRMAAACGEGCGKGSFLSTHPGMGERTERLRDADRDRQ